MESELTNTELQQAEARLEAQQKGIISKQKLEELEGVLIERQRLLEQVH